MAPKVYHSFELVTFICDARFQISINELKLRDQIFDAGALGNFSLAGFEMVRLFKCSFQIDEMKCKWMRYDRPTQLICISDINYLSKQTTVVVNRQIQKTKDNLLICRLYIR